MNVRYFLISLIGVAISASPRRYKPERANSGYIINDNRKAVYVISGEKGLNLISTDMTEIEFSFTYLLIMIQ